VIGLGIWINCIFGYDGSCRWRNRLNFLKKTISRFLTSNTAIRRHASVTGSYQFTPFYGLLVLSTCWCVIVFFLFICIISYSNDRPHRPAGTLNSYRHSCCYVTSLDVSSLSHRPAHLTFSRSHNVDDVIELPSNLAPVGLRPVARWMWELHHVDNPPASSTWLLFADPRRRNPSTPKRTESPSLRSEPFYQATASIKTKGRRPLC